MSHPELSKSVDRFLRDDSSADARRSPDPTIGNIDQPEFLPREKLHGPSCRSCIMREHPNQPRLGCLPEGLSLCALIRRLERTGWAGLAAPSGSVSTRQASALGPSFEGRELKIGGMVIRRFYRLAPNQMAILGAFQAQGWPPEVDNALGQDMAKDVRHRLSDAVAALNKHQTPKLIHFWVEKGTQAVHWEHVGEAANARPK